jgi:hypothetical protein
MRYRMPARHRLQQPETAIDLASDEEIVAMFLQCRSARDQLILLLLSADPSLNRPGGAECCGRDFRGWVERGPHSVQPVSDAT